MCEYEYEIEELIKLKLNSEKVENKSEINK